MIKALIADDNLYFTKEIINTVLSKVPELKVIYLSTTGKETLEMLSKKKFDLVILDLKMSNLNGIDVLDRLEGLNLLKNPKFLVVTGDMQLANEVRKNVNVCNVISKTNSMDFISDRIIDTINDINYEKRFSDIKANIMSEVFKMGYDIKLIGTRYLIESIIFIYESNNSDLVNNLEQNVYKIIAYKHKKTISNIKTNIVKSTKSIYRNDDKSTPKHVINSILARIK